MSSLVSSLRITSVSEAAMPVTSLDKNESTKLGPRCAADSHYLLLIGWSFKPSHSDNPHLKAGTFVPALLSRIGLTGVNKCLPLLLGSARFTALSTLHHINSSVGIDLVCAICAASSTGVSGFIQANASSGSSTTGLSVVNIDHSDP